MADKVLGVLHRSGLLDGDESDGDSESDLEGGEDTPNTSQAQAVAGQWAPAVAARGGDPRIESRGRVLAVDLLPMEPLSGVCAVVGDFMKEHVRELVTGLLVDGKADCVLSDMAHSFIGQKDADHIVQMELAHVALDFAQKVLRRRGSLVVKVRQGFEAKAFETEARKWFDRVDNMKPAASRPGSAEYYLVCRFFRGHGRPRPAGDR